MATVSFVLVALVAVSSALPTDDPVVKKYGSDENRYQYITDDNGVVHLSDSWLKVSDLRAAARFTPDTHNVYHLFTRSNPGVSQPLMLNNANLIRQSNFDARKRTIVLCHGWMNDVTSDFNSVLVPAFLQAEDVNVIVIDWSRGANNINYFVSVENVVTSATSAARFFDFLNQQTGASASQYHLVGHSLGGHQVGNIGRRMQGTPAYITALDPAFPGWITHDECFHADDGAYTEVIHTNAGVLGYLSNLGHVDFYPNGGISMPGCDGSTCDHGRAYYYMAESVTGGVFTGTRCATYPGAMTGNCWLWGTLRMGGITPKTGSSGIFYLETNAGPPFARS